MSAVRNTEVPESSVLGTTDRHEEKSSDSAIQYICMLRGTVQVNVPELPRPEMTAPPTTQSTDKKRNDRISDWTGSSVAHTTVQFSSDVFQ